MAHDPPGERKTRSSGKSEREAVSSIPDGTRVRARRYAWDAVQGNNLLEYPDPRLPTYEGLSEWVEGILIREHVHSPLVPSIDYESVSVDGVEVDPDSVEPIPATVPAGDVAEPTRR